MKKVFLILLIVFSAVYICNTANAANLYVDKTLSANCTTGKYSIQNRNCNGSDGNAYKTIQAALNAMSTGDKIMMRGGTYQEGEILIPKSKNGTAWTSGNYNTLQSYPGEWAILDGQNSLPGTDETAVLGYAAYDKDGSNDLKYWKFERFEIKNGRTANGEGAYGFWGNGGPFWFRFCYIHDNNATSCDNNPGGLTGMVWRGCIVEYCWFDDNGQSGNSHHNCAHIGIHSDYKCDAIAKTGLKDDGHHIQQNIYRYNIFEGSTAIGIKYKNDQYLTPRNPGGGYDYADTYKHYGDKIHHNIFLGMLDAGIDGRQDFLNVYNNIFDSCNIGIMSTEDDLSTLYKQVFYNNTVLGASDRAIGWWNRKYYSFQSNYVWGYNYNNILDGSNSYFIGLTADSGTNANNWHVDRTYFYGKKSGDVLWIMSKDYTVTEWETYRANNNVDCFIADYDANNKLFIGTSGADKYRVNPNHTVESSKSIKSSGLGGSHPYLSGVAIPSYLGAVNPDDDNWVAGVMGLKNITTLKNATTSDPAWIEGSQESSDNNPGSETLQQPKPPVLRIIEE